MFRFPIAISLNAAMRLWDSENNKIGFLVKKYLIKIQYENQFGQIDLLESLMPDCNSCYLIESLQAQH